MTGLRLLTASTITVEAHHQWLKGSLLKRAQLDMCKLGFSTAAGCHCKILSSTNVGILALSYLQPKIRHLGFKIIMFPLFHVVKQTINTMTVGLLLNKRICNIAE